MATPLSACTLYVAGMVVLGTGIQLGTLPDEKPIGALQRALARGEAAPGVPLLSPRDPMANAAMLMSALASVEQARVDYPDPGCRSPPRHFNLQLDGQRSTVRFPARAVCQLARLKQISVAQPGVGRHGVGEVPAFILGKRVPGKGDVDVSRVIVPPFRFSRDTITFLPADLGPLLDGEEMIGSYHTHPDSDLEEGVLSDVDLGFMRSGRVDFHGAVGALQRDKPGLEWLFDIVETRDGDWNVFAHDRPRLEELLHRCESERACPLNDLRVVGSPYYLLTRYYDEREDP